MLPEKVAPTPEMIEKARTALIRKQVAPKASDEEWFNFAYLCKQYNLDPLKKEIYFVTYGGKGTAVTSRDGYLKNANMNPNFDGMESDAVFKGDTLTRRDDGSLLLQYGDNHYQGNKEDLLGAFCNVYRKDRLKAVAVYVTFKEYKKDSPIWTQYTNSMIIKVAESMALKRAFSLSGLVTQEEVDHSDAIEVKIEDGA